jgi:uracil-DNA glycosylase family protein
MARALSARPFLPADTGNVRKLRAAVPQSRGCDLYKHATQAVFGEGPDAARIVLVGEQPGDREDIEGHPFVGPAGGVLKRAMEEAGIARENVYLTNAVKHFSFEERGKRRIHKKPRLSEMGACRPWLEAEIHAIEPSCVVCMGSTAAQSLLGPKARVMAMRGHVLTDIPWAPAVVVTIHPSAVLRSQDDREQYFAMLVEDLKLAKGAATKRKTHNRKTQT